MEKGALDTLARVYKGEQEVISAERIAYERLCKRALHLFRAGLGVMAHENERHICRGKCLDRAAQRIEASREERHALPTAYFLSTQAT